MDITVFTALSGALGSLKAIIDIAKSVNNQQFSQQLNAAVLDVQGKLMEIQQRALSLQQENQCLQDELRGLKDISETAAKLLFDGRVYWKQDDPKFPFCPTCWDVNKCLVRLQLWNEDGGTYKGKQIVEYRCFTHNQDFEVRPADSK